MRSFYYGIRKVSNFIGKIVQYITAAIIVFLLLLSVLQVFLRTFDFPQMGIEELMQFPVIWMYMLGGACASYTKTHIDCGILDSFTKNEKVLEIMAIIKTILSFGVCVIIIGWTNSFLKYCFKTNKISVVLGIPWTYANIAIMAGLILMAFFIIVEFIERICEFFYPEFKEVQ
ncbi:MAG: TRAP transporter small permease [Sedimentibacter sp.]